MPIADRSPIQAAWLTQLQTERAIAVIRADTLAQGVNMAAAVAQAGMKLIEITWNSHRPADLIETVRTRYPHCTVGVGTVLAPQDLKAAIAAGAEFAFSPHTDPELIATAHQLHCPITAGALSPTEILTAWNAGAASVKIFPASLGGPQYIRNLQGPLGHISYVPTGGITASNASAYLEAGAIAVGVASCLFQPRFLRNQDWQGLAQHIQAFRQQILSIASVQN